MTVLSSLLPPTILHRLVQTLKLGLFAVARLGLYHYSAMGRLQCQSFGYLDTSLHSIGSFDWSFDWWVCPLPLRLDPMRRVGAKIQRYVFGAGRR